MRAEYQGDSNLKRDSGIPALGMVGWGTNICVFYETSEDLLKLTASFFKAGLDHNERCIWAVSRPVTIETATKALQAQIPNIEDLLQSGTMSVTKAQEWEVRPGEFNLQRITENWQWELETAERHNFDGLRLSGNASWLEAGHWSLFCPYDRELDRTVAGRKILLLCTHPLSANRAIDMIEPVQAHHVTLYCRNSGWEFPQIAELAQPNAQIQSISDPRLKLAGSMYAFVDLTPRERVVLTEIVRGASSKEIASLLGISPRTVEFHRANIMSKVGVKNVAGLVRMISGQQVPLEAMRR